MGKPVERSVASHDPSPDLVPFIVVGGCVPPATARRKRETDQPSKLEACGAEMRRPSLECEPFRGGKLRKAAGNRAGEYRDGDV